MVLATDITLIPLNRRRCSTFVALCLVDFVLDWKYRARLITWCGRSVRLISLLPIAPASAILVAGTSY